MVSFALCAHRVTDISRVHGAGIHGLNLRGSTLNETTDLSDVFAASSDLRGESREPEADWLETLNQPPSEVVGPPGGADESVAFTADGQAIYIIPEGEGAAIYRYDFADQP